MPAALDQANPEGRQLAWWSRAVIDAWLRISVWRGTRSGFTAVFAIDGEAVYGTAAGWADIGDAVPMSLDTRMRFASMTKPVTAVAAMMLVEDGLLGLDDPVASYLPAFADLAVAASSQPSADGSFRTVPLDKALTVRHLLLFASGIGPGRGEETPLLEYWRKNGPRSHAAGSLGDRIDKLAGLPLFEQPGERWRYGWSADVLARVVEVASGQSLDAFFRRRIFEPLGMQQTHFRFDDPAPDSIATVYTQDPDGNLTPVRRPDSDTGYPEGGSGLVSSTQDYLRFALMLWNGGEYRGVRLLNTATVQEMTRLHLREGVLASEDIDGLGWGLGMAVVADADATPFGDRNGDFFWSGYFGTTFFVSPSTGLVGVVLSQNEPGPYSDLPIALYMVQGLALAGLQ